MKMQEELENKQNIIGHGLTALKAYAEVALKASGTPPFLF